MAYQRRLGVVSAVACDWGGGSGGAGGWLGGWGGWGVHGVAGNASRRHCLLVGAAAVGGSLIGAVGAMGPFWPGVGPFRAEEGLWDVSKVESSARAPSEVNPAGKLQWHFTCGFDFRHSLWLPFVAAFAVLKGLSGSFVEEDTWRAIYQHFHLFSWKKKPTETSGLRIDF